MMNKRIVFCNKKKDFFGIISRKTHLKKPTKKPTRSFEIFKNFGCFKYALYKKQPKYSKIELKVAQICNFTQKIYG